MATIEKMLRFYSIHIFNRDAINYSIQKEEQMELINKIFLFKKITLQLMQRTIYKK